MPLLQTTKWRWKQQNGDGCRPECTATSEIAVAANNHDAV
jgi:hypothetical protein